MILRWLRMRGACESLVLVFCLGIRAQGADSPRSAVAETEMAKQIDAGLVKAIGQATPLPSLADDATFLRRVSLDLTGKLPSPKEVEEFLADRRPDKRARKIDQLLSSEAYAVNWGRYWRDALTYHTPASGNYLRWKLFDEWWTDRLRRNEPWDRVVTSLVTASGINDESAPVNYLTALYGNPSEIAA